MLQNEGRVSKGCTSSCVIVVTIGPRLVIGFSKKWSHAPPPPHTHTHKGHGPV